MANVKVQAYSCGSDGDTVKVDNEARPLQRLVEHLDHAFLHGLKHITPGYWVFVRRFTHKLVISDILGLDRLATDLGRSRAWLYQSLNEGALESYFRCFQGSQDVLKKFYIEHALMRDSERLTLLMTLVSGLDFVTFDLELNVAYFDLVSHVPRSATDLRDLDDTVSIHSSASVESATSSMVNDLDAHSLLGIEGGSSHDGLPEEVIPSRLKDDDTCVKVCVDDVEDDEIQESDTSPREEIEQKEISGSLGNPTEDSSSTCLPSGTESHETDDTNDIARPLTLDLATQSNNNSSNELKHVTRNYSTPDFDINMEKVAEQDQNLEVIRIRKKTKKKKKRKSSKGNGQAVLKLQEPRRGKRRDRSSSPSTVSIASSCIEESELEDKEHCPEGLEGPDGSISSATNLSECSAVEEDGDCGKVLASSLPESEITSQEHCNGTKLHDFALEKNSSQRGECLGSQELDKKESILEECSEILDCVCEQTREPVPKGEPNVFPQETFDINRDHISDEQVPVDTAKLRLPKFADPTLQDSFNSSVDGVDQSMIYWQGDITDNSFDTDVTSSTPVKVACRVGIRHELDDIANDDDDVFLEENGAFESGISILKESVDSGIREHRQSKLKATVTNQAKRQNSDKQKSRERTVSGTLDYEHTISVQLRTQQTMISGQLQGESPSPVSDLPVSPDSGINQSFGDSNLSEGINACSADSLSSGIASNPDTDGPTSATANDSNPGSSEASSLSRKGDSLYSSSGLSIVQSIAEDVDGFVLVDVLDDPGDLGERSQGDGKDASMDPLCAVDINANDGGPPGPVDVGTYNFDCDEDREEVTTHEAEMKVDNNLKLYLMLEIFKIEDENYQKLIRLSTGHMEGNLLQAFILLTDLAIYILRRGERNGRFSTESRTLYHDLDYVLIGLNFQSVQLVCKNRRKHFWLTTGSRSLTRFFLHSLRGVMETGKQEDSLCVLTDATAQAIGLKKYVAGEEKVEMSDVQVYLYSLVHWEDLLDSNTAADLQLYLPPTKRKGMLHYKTKESFFVGSYWKAAFFKLKQNVLKRYQRKDAEEPDLVIDLGSHKFGGCRRIHHTDRRFSFELVFTNGSPSLQLSCENELQLSHWLQSLCEVASHQHSMSQMKGPRPNPCQPSCAVITSRSVLLCLEDYQTHFFRTLARTDLTTISRVERSQSKLSYLVMNFKNMECDNPWLLYFNCSKELDNFVSHLAQAFHNKTQKELRIGNVQDEKLAKRCSNCQELILSAWQRSDSLGRGRVRGDSW
ncbi:pleckstrin homology domain-containing family M member 2-like [Lytechinus pictus]|uniref:pleckstrin homology domain-containing family M member 2-like n=1 Tax=Lytechinus pictus TaxID=7653 RepID=UPI0030B9EE8F